MSEPREIDVPEGMFVQCPLKDMKLSPVRVCEGCRYFDGLTEYTKNERWGFHQRFSVQCRGGVVERRIMAFDLKQIEIKDDPNGGDH